MVELKLVKSKVLHCKFEDSNKYPEGLDDVKLPIRLMIDSSESNDSEVGDKISITSTITFGEIDKYIYVELRALSIFEVLVCDEGEKIDAKCIEKNCLPVSTQVVRDYFNNVVNVLDFPEIKLPMFNFEKID